ncbi:hypothetical protein [Microbacterium sp. GCM10011525]|uniref:hypothetical protein n=1 Tax=unclassified Microbacterium TaxID=2609290 RepID=UPI0012F88B44|nr:hypothetical protein [Microbacterium sp. MAH-37]
MAWLLAQERWIVAIPGTHLATRLEENFAATSVRLSADDLPNLNGLAARIDVKGDRYNSQHIAYVNCSNANACCKTGTRHNPHRKYPPECQIR